MISAPIENLRAKVPRSATWWDPEPLRRPKDLNQVESHELTLLTGEPVTYVRRDAFDERTGASTKDFYVWRHGGAVVDANDIDVGAWPLFGADALRKKDRVVVVTEGLRAAGALRKEGIAAVGTLTGATRTPAPAALEPLSGRVAVLWPDNDDIGVSHMARIAEALQGVAGEIRIVRWKGGPHHGDAADLVASGVTGRPLRQLVDAAEPWDPGLIISAAGPPKLKPAPSPLFLRAERQMDVEKQRWV